MKRTQRTIAYAFLALSVGLWATPVRAQVSNLSGTWKLNLKKSDFGNGPRPTKSSVYKITHKEPNLKFTVTGWGTDGTRLDMSFDGAIDGKPHPFKWNGRDARLAIKRVAPNTTRGVLTLEVGPSKMELENYTLTVSKDGKSMTRKATSMGGLTQTLVYDKQ